MSTYLNKYISVLNDVQAKQLTSLLIEKKNNGSIQTLDELKIYLSNLTNKIISSVAVPSLKLFFGQENQVIDSETYNFMLDRIRNDLDSIFTEIDNIDNLIDDHNNLVTDGVLKSIELAVDLLENKVSAYEFLASTRTGLDNAQSNTFKSAQTSRITRTSPDVGIYFLDPKTNNIISNDVLIDTIGQQITLGADNLSYVPIKSIEQIFDEQTKQSADIVSFNSNNITNVIDGANGTYWTYSILQEEQSSTGILLKLLLKIAGVNNINFIEIEPATIFNMDLLSIEYIDANSATKNIPNIEQSLLGDIRINFSAITTDTIILTLRQKHAAVVEYEDKTTNNNFNLAAAGITSDVNIQNLISILQSQIKSGNLLQTAFMINSTPTLGASVKYYDYEVGFDNIRVGLAEFAEDSIFVSEAIVVNKLSQVGLKSTETRPILTGDIFSYSNPNTIWDGSFVYQGSVEYYCVIKNYNTDDNLVSINTVPIIPTQSDKIYQECLILNSQVMSVIPNVGTLANYTRLNSAADNISVYRNNNLLSYGVDWIIENFPLTNDFLPPNGLPNRTSIRIMSPTENDFYTVTYTPLVSSTRTDPKFILNDSSINTENNISIIDLVGDASIKIGIDNILYIDNDADHSSVSLVIILRSNSKNLTISPAVKDYVLLTSSADPNKIKGQNV